MKIIMRTDTSIKINKPAVVQSIQVIPPTEYASQEVAKAFCHTLYLSHELGYIDKDLKVHPDICNKLIYLAKPGEVTLARHWHRNFCERGGVWKRTFWEFQCAIYELKEYYDNGSFSCTILLNDREMVPVINPTPSRTGTAHEKVKQSKRENRRQVEAGVSSCTTKKLKCQNGYIHPCCVAFDQNRVILVHK